MVRPFCRTPGRTSLSEVDFARALREVTLYLRVHGRIRNRELRRLAGLNYDQAIKFFNRATEGKLLARRGTASGTYYELRATGRAGK